MSDELLARVRPVFVGHRCVGHTLRHARGFDAYDSENQLVGTYDRASTAVDALRNLTRHST
jgi:hypothetical protein